MANRCRIIESNKVICRQPGRYIGWPTIARTRDEELLVVFSGDRDGHVCPLGKSFVVRSGDNGRTWSGPALINDTPFDDRDTGLLACRDGTVLMSWFTSHYTIESYLARCADDSQRARWRKHLEGVTDDDIRRWAGLEVIAGRYDLGHWIRRSVDGGRTWQQPVRVDGTTPHGPIELSDGRVLLVGTNGVGRYHETRRGLIIISESRDKGQSWSAIASISPYPAYGGDVPGGMAYLTEPHAVEVSPGRLVMMARYEELPRETGRNRSVLWQAESSDGGRTWTKPRPTAIWGKPPHLTRLADGRILVSYGHRREPFGERACVSGDGGKTWDYDNEIIFSQAPSGDLGYPSSVQLADGTIYSVFYQREEREELPCLMATHWAIEG